MKQFRKVLTAAVALLMTFGLAVPVLADENSQHTITIENTDQNVSHTYEGYQIFKGKLDLATESKLSDIVWGDGVDGDAFLEKLKGSNVFKVTGDNPATDATETEYNLFDNCTTAADVAKVFADIKGTAANVDEFARILADEGVTKADKKITFEESEKVYTATVTGDGYYFVKDVTTKLNNGETTPDTPENTHSDTLSKYILQVVKNVKVEAKDTGLNPDKEIVKGNERVKEGTAAVGDTVTFEVTLSVPDTTRYVDHFVLVMNDKLPVGMTLTGVTSVKVGTIDVPNTVTVAENDSNTYAAYTAPADPVNAAGGQKIKIVFNDFKTFAEADRDPDPDSVQNLIGKNIVITYTAVVNKAANFTPTGNINEVVFDYSNDPNHDYNGDEPGPNEPKGTTPKSTTKTCLTNIEILKTGDNGTVTALEGAEFEITSEDYNVTLVTGEKFEEDADGTYYLLKDGTYTETAPKTDTASYYQSTETKYKKVPFSQTVTTPGNTKKVTVITGADGKIKLEGLKPGTYTIKETKGPNGYNLDNTKYKIVLEWDATAKKIVLDTVATEEDPNKSSDGVVFDGTTATAKLTIDDKSGTVLPSTGGMGTTLFYVVGTLLVLGAGIVLVSKRRVTE